AQRILREHPTVAYIQNAMANRDLDEAVEATNQPEAAGSKAYDIRPQLPETDHGAIIITSRSSTVRLGPLIRLRKLGDVDDSLSILDSTSNRANLSQNSDAYTLARRLDGLPLALSTAGAYLNQVSTTCAEYLQLYDESWLRLQRESPQLLDYDQALYSTWEVSFKHIQQQSRGAAMLLRLWAYFHNEDLWYELLREGGPERPDWLQDITEDKLNFNATMRVLCEHGIVEADPPIKESGVDSRGYCVHGCVHAWMVHVLNKGVDEEMAWTAIRCVASHVPSNKQQEYWMVQRRLLQHADRCITRTPTDAAEEEDAWMFHYLGNLYKSQGRLKEAEAMYQRALEGKEKAWGPDHTSTLDTVNNLGNLYKSQGRLKEAEAMYQRALEGKEKAWGPDHTSTLDTVNNLGLLYSDQGRLKEAEAMYQRAFEGYEKVLGPYAVKTYIPALNTLQNLGSLFEELGENSTAISYYQQAQNGFLSVLGSQNERYTYVSDKIGSLQLFEQEMDVSPSAEKPGLVASSH
ncbi:TPR-like protein, partial [Colletotrichum caudatum]